MQEPIPFVTFAIIIVTVVTSMIGFKNSTFVERFIFCPEYILRYKQSYRLVTSAFLHANGQHLAFNMFSFYAFGKNIEMVMGIPALLAIYFASILGGGLLSLLMHRHHIYKAYGASGGVCGIIFAAIFLFPGSSIYVLVPIPIPSWLYAIAYLLLSFYGIKRGRDNIGHDAHLGGAIIGLLTATVMYPGIVETSPKLYAAVMILSVGMLIYLVKNPLFLPLDSFASTNVSSSPRAPEPRQRKVEAPDINAILEKISKSGLKSLTKAEHEALQKASQKSRRQSGMD